MKSLRITIDGKTYDVNVEVLDEGSDPSPAPTPTAAPVRSAAVSAPVASAPAPRPASTGGASGPGVIVSPLAGKVVTIDVGVGDSVKSGDKVATLEAMKMNTFIYAESDGTVAQVMANPDQMVDEGAPLLKLA